MDQDDLFLEVATQSDDPWAPTRRRVKEELLAALRSGPVQDVADLDAALALVKQLNEDFTAYGTGGGEELTNDEAALALRTLKRVLGRLGVPITIPFRDFHTFRTYWNAHDGYGSWQARREMVAEVFEPVFARLYELIDAEEAPAVADAALSALPNVAAIRDHLSRLQRNVDTDPRLAVSVAKDLVESTAKLILRERGVDYLKRDDLPALVSRAQETLALSASQVTHGTDEAAALKTILGSLTRLTQGVTELRNQVGVGHGKESVPSWVRPRHARLAAGAASTWCNLMLETFADPEAPWRNDAM